MAVIPQRSAHACVVADVPRDGPLAGADTRFRCPRCPVVTADLTYA
ncbi:hypothetical protein SLNWT_4170 [Streptomyces albus]|uniref:Uncharacterized protein n=1 Tax=Streptomyces albus (strain ATCC 21838 / DSM 41398 / FERM P-419 / JCM 4703 / NBRC 107858) TaxID=1081613 RepID=A0A0B5F0Y9_STRA4|nr:hypothetical protein SLNWT_4170 [Streptomyces albus]AOU78856.1 hypothetical protein SLNHY_4165 [Streptomyces albus]AYN34590.1 hypothetical protein DUI70_4093 [Streptomyces albus]